MVSIPDEIRQLIDLPLMKLLSLANHSRNEIFGSTFEVCSIINAKSGLCNQDCLFCAQSSKYHAGSKTYPLLTESKILDSAFKAKKLGAQRVSIVTSGHSLNKTEIAELAKVISKIKTQTGLKICASLGILAESDLISLKKAGLSRYHHNIETSASFYPEICTTHSFEDRISTIRSAQKAGLEVCSGGILGIGETFEDRIRMALVLKELAVNSVPLNILIPIKGTPLESAPPLNIMEIIRTIALFRIILKDQTINIAAGREKRLKDFQGLAFMSGANGMIIGGYLTVGGREPKEDQQLIQDVLASWDLLSKADLLT